MIVLLFIKFWSCYELLGKSEHLMNVLVAEISPIFEHWLEKELSKIHGFATIEKVNNVKEAKRRIFKNHFDVAIIDVRLNGGLGTDIITAIRNKRMNTIIIVFSNYSEFEFQCMKLGANYFFDKTYDHKELINVLNKLPKLIGKKSMYNHPSP